jgi:hypothetical protein
MHPISAITQRYECLGWNAKTGNAIKDSVIDKGLAIFQEVTTPTARVKILSLTDAAENYLRSRGITLPRTRQGGAAHEYWKWTIRNLLPKRGYTVDEEYAVGDGKTVDLRAQRDDNVIWIEVETGRSDIAANAQKCATLTGRVVFIFTDPAVRDEYRDVIPGEAITTAELTPL